VVRLGLAGWALVALGVAGEGIAEYFVDDAETDIRQFDEGVSEQAQRSANSAAAAASLANFFGERAQKKADEASGSAISAREETAKLKAQSVELSNRLSAANTQLDAVEAKRAELAQSLLNFAVCVAPRVITIVQVNGKETSTEQLRNFPGYKAAISFIPNDAEARRAAFNISDALKFAGWVPSDPVPMDGINDGVEIQPFVGHYWWNQRQKDNLYSWQAGAPRKLSMHFWISSVHTIGTQGEAGLLTKKEI
jgi:hypothetical protein